MKSQRRIAVLLILLEAAAFGYFSATLLFPAAIALAALAGAGGPRRLPIAAEQRSLLGLLLAGGFVLKFLAAPYKPPHTMVFLLYPLAHVIAQFTLCWQIIGLHVRREGEPLPPLLPLQGVLVLICTADVQVTGWQSAVYQACVLGFVTLSALYFGASRQTVEPASPRSATGRQVLSVLTMALTLWVAWIGSTLLDRYWYDLERIFAQFSAPESRPKSIGFLRQAQLGNVAYHKSLSEESPALRIYAARAPGYLRGAAYDQYNKGRWETHVATHSAALLEAAPADLPRRDNDRRLFAIGPPSAGPWQRMEIWPEILISEAVFTSLGTGVISLPAENVTVDDHEIAQAPDLRWGQPYRIFRTADPAIEPLSAEYAVRNADVPPELDPRLRTLAAQVFAGCTTPRAKIAAVEEYFHRNYRYQLGIEIPPQTDPLTHFLLAKPAAHCEYFASGATILLRMAGVPCRYVTGFVAVERNPLGDYWLARNKDAHAWAEAYLPDEGWVTVEATPSDGVPSGRGALRMSHMWDDFVFRVQIIRALIVEGGVRGLFAALKALLSALATTLPGLVITAGLLVWGTVIALRIKRRREQVRREPAFRNLNRLLARMDRRLKRWNLERRPSETLHQFAARVAAAELPAGTAAQAAAWYLHYASLRYQGTVDPGALEQLRQALETLGTPAPT